MSDEHYGIDKHAIRNLIFNAEMALIDLKRFCHDRSFPLSETRARASELSAASADIAELLSPFTAKREQNGADHAPA